MSKKENGYTGETELSIRVSGPQMNSKSGYNLDAVINSLQDTQALVRRTYLAAQKRSRFTTKDAESFEVRLKDWREGSLWSDLGIFYQNVVLPTIPFVVSNKDFIWETIKDSYDFLKAKLTAKKEGRKIQVEQKAGEHGVNITSTGNNTIILVGSGLPEMAEAVKPAIQQVTQNIDPGVVDSVQITADANSNDPNESIFLDNEDKSLFGESQLTSDDLVEISGKIVVGNYNSNSGKIEITGSSVQSIKPGQTYRMKINSELHAEDKWREMFLQDRPYYCRYSVSAQNPNVVTLITITDWDDKEWD